jgi:LPS-assembly protein
MLCLLVTSLLYAGPGFAELPEIDVDTSRVTLHGERTLRDGRRKLTTLEGSATMLGDGVAVDADRIVYDETNRSATASGHVVARLASEGLMVVVGDVVTLKFEGDEVREVYLLDGRALAKKDTTAAALLAANTAEAAEKIGTTMGLLQGNHLTHDGGRWSAEQISLVPCECDFNKPSWNITAASATMDTKAERIALVSPVVRVFHVPVLWLPWLSLPMNSRQTGLLFPRPNWSPLNGYSLEAPVFVTLGRSADLTLTPGLFTGGTGTFGVAGPRLLAELRYVPSRRATGKVNLGLLWDLRDVRDPITKVGWRVPQAVGRAPRGLRGELAWSHAQDLERGFGTRVEFNAYSDGFYNRDINTDVVGSTNGLLRSTALLFHRGDQHVLTLDLTLRQDLNFGYDWLGQRPLVEGWTSPRFGPGVLQRLPALTLMVPGVALGGPVSLDFTGEFVRLSPLFSSTGDEGVGANEGDPYGPDGVEQPWLCRSQRAFGPGGAACAGAAVDKTGAGDRVWQAGEREARDRLMLFPRLKVAGSILRAVTVSAWAGWRQSAWAGEVSGRTWQRGTLLMDARAQTGFGRTYGELRHLVEPLVAVRAVPVVVRGSSDSASEEPVPYDEIDGAVPRGGGVHAQAVAELRQRLLRRGGAELLRLELGQGVRLASPERTAPGLAEAYGKLALQLGWFRGQVSARFEPTPPVRLTRLAAVAGLDDGRGHGVSASYDNLLDDGNDRLRAPIELLFGAPVLPFEPSDVNRPRAQVLAGGPGGTSDPSRCVMTCWCGRGY